VIGINSAIYSPNGGNVGIGFAIPAEMAEPVLTDLRDKGQVERGWLGVTVQGLDEDLAKGLDLDSADGALVADVVDGSPAQAAGVQSGDVIVAIDGDPVDSPRTLARRVAGADPDQPVQLQVWRNGKSMTLAATLGEGSEAPTNPAAAPSATGDSSERHLGLALRTLSDQARRNLRLGPDVSGVLIAAVEPGSEAARHGLQAGDVLLRVGTTPVTDPAEARDAIEAAAKADRGSIVLQVLRNGSSRFLALDLS